MISLRARVVRLITKQIFKSISGDDDVEPVRDQMEKLAKRSRPAPGTHIRHATIAGVECDWVVPKNCDESRVLLYLHGGAYLLGSSKTHRTMVSHIAKQAGVRAILPNYRLGPEDPFPAGLDDCLAVYRQLLVSGVSPKHIVVGGDSAGGGMAMATLLSLKDAGDPMPAAACLLSPWLDLTGEGESRKTRAELDPWFRTEDMPKVTAHYCLKDQLRDPLVSPVYGNVRGLPPIFIQVGDHEVLLSDSTRIAEKISSAGGKVTLQIWPEMWHVFQYFVGKMPESKRAIRQIGAFLRGQLDAADSVARASRAA
jgi:monoterpene epsilon-lactone hydrolase